VFTARYARGPCIKQIRFVFKGLSFFSCKFCTCIKSKVHPGTGHEGLDGEERYSCTLCLISALDGVGGPCHAPAAFYPGKVTRYPSYRSLSGLQDRYGRVWKISSPSRFDPRTIQPVARLYTDYTIPALSIMRHFKCQSDLINILHFHYPPCSYVPL
jgi:hypothetical protein